MDNNTVSRRIFSQLESHLDEEEITLLIGPRQAGKTTLVLQLMEHLIKKDDIAQANVFYFNLDVVSDRLIFESQTNVIQFIKNRISHGRKLYVFVDEAQRIPDAGIYFKGIYDLKLPLKLILTGSSSLELRAKTIEPLTGRKKLFKLFPLSFREYISFKDSSLVPFIDKEDKFAQEKLLDHLFTFIIFGGYPKVILEEDLSKKIDYLEEIYTSYLEKDVVGFLHIRDSLFFSKLVKIISEEIGNLFNTENTSRELQIKNQTVKNYLSALEGTFVAKRVNPYFTSTRAEIRKMPKVYFYDTGLRNFIKDLRDFFSISFKERHDNGALLENFIFSELLKSDFPNINFWRTKDGAEVDFVLNYKSNIIPIEIKVAKLNRPSFPRGVTSFIQRYKPKIGIIINMEYQSVVNYQGTEIHYMLPYQLSSFLESI